MEDNQPIPKPGVVNPNEVSKPEFPSPFGTKPTLTKNEFEPADVSEVPLEEKGDASLSARHLKAGRAEALKKYVMTEYGLDASKFTVKSTPEDWDGLRAYVEKSNLPLKDKVLDIIDNDQSHKDDKEHRIRALDAKMYQTLLQDCYPALRHSDYVVNYVVRAYTDINEIKDVDLSQV